MDQNDAELGFQSTDFHPTDFHHEMPALQEDEAPETPVELSSQCYDGDAADPPFSSSSCDAAPASEPAGERVLTEEVSTTVDLDLDDNEVAAMPGMGDTGGIAIDESSSMTVEVVNSGPVKRKRGRPRKNPEAKATPPVRKKEREDVCFVCFDRRNPNLVACNRRGCYKAYHPTCVNRDDTFFRSKGKWNCGCHICSTCQKAAHYMCYTCTTSYCKECVSDESKYVCVRGTYGFCQSCHNTVTLIELNKLAFDRKDDLDFDDTCSFTYLFKTYWLDLKGKLSMTPEEFNNARHPYSIVQDEDSSDELYDINDDRGSSSESSSDHKSSTSSKRKSRSRSQAIAVEKNPVEEVDGGGTVMPQETGWASMELLELVAHMRNGDQSFISQFDVQALLLDYIKKYNLRDPRRKSQIICDFRLRNLFGKERVGHFEMLKLLESHFLSKEVPQIVVDGNQAETSDTDSKLADDVEGDTFTTVISEKRRKNRKKTEEIEPQLNVDDYAAIDVHNITLIFLRRSLLEDLLDIETFDDKVIGAFVRIRISNAGQRQDLYRLVQIVGTQESSKPYKVGKKTTDIVLEILNLNKKEISTIDSISNQDFTEEECQRLRQSIKCGLIDRLKVGYIQEKAKVLQAVRVNDSIETEKLRLSHLRDRASETGRRKELRECIEKLQLLNNPDERRRRLNEVPQIHADPKMDPEYESSEEDKNQDYQSRSKEALFLKNKRELIPRGRAGAVGSNWNGMHRGPNFNGESSRRMLGEVWQDGLEVYNQIAERPNEVLLNQSKDVYQTEANFTSLQTPSPGNYAQKSSGQQSHGSSALDINSATPENCLPSIPNEVDKMWHYQDPSMNIQGPFSISQLRKWNTTGYFPPDMRIWKTCEKQEDSKLLVDVLAGRFYKEPPQQVTQHGGFPHQPVRAEMQQIRDSWNAHQTIKQPAFDGLPSPSPGVDVSNSFEGKPGIYSSSWSSNPRPVGPSYSNTHHIPVIQNDSMRGNNGSGWKQEQDYGNIWSPTRPTVDLPGKTRKVEENHTFDPSIVSANEVNGRMNKYQSYENDCPSPTPKTEMKESYLRHDEIGSAMAGSEALDRFTGNSTTPAETMAVNHAAAASLGTLNSSLASHSALPAAINFESSNTATAVGILTDKVPGNGMRMVDNTKSASTGFQDNFFPIASVAGDLCSGHEQMSDSSSVQKQFSIGSPLASSFHGMENDQSQNLSNYSPIHQLNPQNTAGELESSLPSPTPKNSKNTWGIVDSSASSNVSWGGPPQGVANTGWAAQAQMNSPANTGWSTLKTNANTGWGAPVQANTNTNIKWGLPMQLNANTNTVWRAPTQVNTNVNTGWGTVPQGNGWGASSTTIGLGYSNPGSTGEAIPRHENDASVRADWRSSYGSRNGKSSDRDSSRRFDFEGHNGDGYSRHGDRDMGRRSGRGGLTWSHQVSAGGDGPRGVCKFFENGHCKKGRSCKYLHNDLRREI